MEQLQLPLEVWDELNNTQENGAAKIDGRLEHIKGERAKLAKRLAGYQEMRADGELSKEDYAKRVKETDALDQVLATEQASLAEQGKPLYVDLDEYFGEHTNMMVEWIEGGPDFYSDDEWTEIITQYNVRLEVRTKEERDIYSDLGGVVLSDLLLIQ